MPNITYIKEKKGELPCWTKRPLVPGRSADDINYPLRVIDSSSHWIENRVNTMSWLSNQKVKCLKQDPDTNCKAVIDLGNNDQVSFSMSVAVAAYTQTSVRGLNLRKRSHMSTIGPRS